MCHREEGGTDCHPSIPQPGPLHPRKGRSPFEMALWSPPLGLILGVATTLSIYSLLLHLEKTPKYLHREFPYLLITCLMYSFGIKNASVGGHSWLLPPASIWSASCFCYPMLVFLTVLKCVIPPVFKFRSNRAVLTQQDHTHIRSLKIHITLCETAKASCK